jgi:arylsulfatase A-like enzyme
MKKTSFSGRIIAMAFVFVFAGACRRPAPVKAGVVHLLDLLTAEGIGESPLRKTPSGTLTEVDYPIDSQPLDYVAANPLDLKRRHNLGNVENRILFAPSRSIYRIPLDLPDDPVLDFGIGIVRDHNADKSGRGPASKDPGVEFVVRLEIEGRERTVFQRHLSLPPQRESRTVNYAKEKIPLPGGGRKAVLTLLTGGESGAFAFWHEPQVFGRSGLSLPNVIIVSLDTLRADHVGAYGYSRETTPNIDALAKDGALFENTYASSPWTLPSHVSMLSGLNCVRHGVYSEADRVPSSTPWLATFLHNNGYTCGAVTGGGYVSSFFGFARGFDSYGMSQKEIGNEGNADEAARQSLDWLEANADRPFFLFVHTYQLHLPYGPREPYKKMFLDPDAAVRNIWDWKEPARIYEPISDSLKRNIVALYDGSIRLTDEVLIKALVERLKSLGLYNRTLLIVTSDHGEEFFDHGGWAHTRTVYDEVIKVPLVVHFPGGKHAGRRVKSIVRSVDIVPTVLEELGVDFAPDDFDGRGLLSVLDGRETADRHFVAELAPSVTQTHNHAAAAVNSGRNKIIINGRFSRENMAYFMFPPPSFPAIELFDLTSDPGEKTNVMDRPERAAAARELAGRGEALMNGLKNRTGDMTKLPKNLEDQLRSLGYIK